MILPSPDTAVASEGGASAIEENITVQVFNFHDDNVSLNITLPNGDIKSKVASKDEKIPVTEEVVITARVIQGKCQARLGITAPGSMAITTYSRVTN